ncbi:MAG: hypothetical protein ABIS51_22295 [Sphingomonas sp.]
MSEPGVPFPMKIDADRVAAQKHGFDPDFAFPVTAVPSAAKLALGAQNRVLGVGKYKAHEIAGVVTITGEGTVPNLNTVAQLVQLPLMIWPPRYALYFTSPEIVIPASRPFIVSATFQSDTALKAVVVQDKNGLHTVPVQNF